MVLYKTSALSSINERINFIYEWTMRNGCLKNFNLKQPKGEHRADADADPRVTGELITVIFT